MRSEVFITDGHWRKSLAAGRALGRKGIKVTVGESTCLATASFSRHCHRSVVYPSPLHRPSEFIDFLRKALSRISYQMLLPMEDETLHLISQYYSEFSRLTYLPIVSFEKLSFAQSKDNILQMAEKRGIPVPKTWYIDDISQINKLKDSLPYPIVIKPKKSSGAVGICYSKQPGDLMEQYLSVHQRFPYPLIQEFIPQEGPGYGASFLLDERGRVKASFVINA